VILAQVMFEFGGEQRSGIAVLVGVVIALIILGSGKKK